MKWNKLAGLFTLLCVSLNAYCQQDTLRLTLQDVLQMAEEKSHSIKESQYLVQQAWHELKDLKKQFTPDIHLSATAGYQGEATWIDRGFTVQINQPIWDMELHRALGVKHASNQAVEVQAQLQRQEVRFMLADWFLQYLRYLNLQQVLEEDKTRIGQLLKETADRYTEGIALKSDVTSYKLELQKRELDMRKNENLLQVLRYQLGCILELPENQIVYPVEDIPSAEELSQADCEVHATPAYRESVFRYQEALESESLAGAVRWPKLSGWFENSLSGPLSSVNPSLNKSLNHWGVGITLSYNLSSLYKNRSQLKAAKWYAQASKERMEQAHDEVDMQLFDARTKLNELLDEFELRREQTALSEELYRLMYDRYTGGTAIQTELMDARNHLLEAKIGYLNLQIEAYYQYCLIKRMMGEL